MFLMFVGMVRDYFPQLHLPTLQEKRSTCCEVENEFLNVLYINVTFEMFNIQAVFQIYVIIIIIVLSVLYLIMLFQMHALLSYTLERYSNGRVLKKKESVRRRSLPVWSNYA